MNSNFSSSGRRSQRDSQSAMNRRCGFTLNELLIVVAIMVLVIALAVPAFNVITNARSIDSAENQIASFLAGTRAEAVGLQEPRGVIFFKDVDTGRFVLAQVYYPPTMIRPNIDLFGDRDELLLTKGVGLQGVPTNVTGPITPFPWQPYAIIMFDGDGKLMTDNVQFTATSKLGLRLAGSTPTALATATPANIGFVLYDLPAYEELAAAAQKQWLEENATPMLVNRYNGTLLRAP